MIAPNILRRLRISNRQLQEQKAFFLEFYPNKAKIRLLIDRLSDETRYCYMCDSQGECSLFMAICYFALGEYGKGILRAEEAEQHFLNVNNTWNLIHALELHGLILDAQGNRHQAILTYKEAIRTLQEQYNPTHDQDYDPQVEELQKEFDLLISEGNPIPASANLQLGIMPVYSL